MIRYVVAVRDSAMNAFASPVCVPAIAAATRSFTDEVNNAQEGNQLYKHPEDFELHLLGGFEEETGTFVQSGDYSPRMLTRGKDVKAA